MCAYFFVFKVLMTEKVQLDEPDCVCVCACVHGSVRACFCVCVCVRARALVRCQPYMSEISEAIAIKFVTATASFTRVPSRVNYIDLGLHSRSHKS